MLIFKKKTLHPCLTRFQPDAEITKSIIYIVIVSILCFSWTLNIKIICTDLVSIFKLCFNLMWPNPIFLHFSLCAVSVEKNRNIFKIVIKLRLHLDLKARGLWLKQKNSHCLLVNWLRWPIENRHFPVTSQARSSLYVNDIA